jgi:hypothetical protein
MEDNKKQPRTRIVANLYGPLVPLSVLCARKGWVQSTVARNGTADKYAKPVRLVDHDGQVVGETVLYQMP